MGMKETGRREHVPQMHYEGDKNHEETLICVWTIDGDEVFRHPYSHILIYASMLNCNFKVRLALMRWAEMLVNPA